MNELDGGLLEREIEAGMHLRGAMQSSLMYRFALRRQTYEDLVADLTTHFIRSSIRPSGSIDIEFNAHFGDSIDYSHAREGYRWELTPELSLNLGKHIRIDLDHELTDFTVGGERLYRANVTQSRFIYQFNSRMFVRSILQYVDIRRNQALYEDEIDPISKRLFSQLLFSYKLNARTVFYLGYSDNYRAYQDIDFTRLDRAVFLKIGYAWVL
jgi:hypothetical protein